MSEARRLEVIAGVGARRVDVWFVWQLLIVGECNSVEMEAKPGLWGALGVVGCGDLMLRMLKVLLMKEVILEMVV